jgi:PqqA peptide cyclase
MSEFLPVKTTDRPLTLIAELTYRCPLSCPYCSNPLNYHDKHYRQELATDDWLRTIRQARNLGVWQLGFSGGEPLLRQDLEVLVKAAAQVELYTTLVTAGTLLTLERATQLCHAGLNHIQISIQDSRAAQSDYLAGIRCFEQKLAAARIVKDLGLPLTLNFVLHHRAALLPTPQQLERAAQIVAVAKKSRICPMGILYVIPDYYEDYPKPCMGGWGRRALVVAPHGDVMPCQAASSIPEIEFTNVRDRDLDWIWFESPAFNRFRGTDWMSEPCRSCDRAQIDFGGCRCQALLLTNNAAATDPVCHLSPHHDLVVTAREEALEQSLPLVHRSSVASLGVKEAYHK